MHTRVSIALLVGLALGGLVVFLAPTPSIAQPVLTVKRIVNNWPRIDLFFTVGCNGLAQYTLPKESFSIFENGIPVTDFTISCPDPSVRCPSSVSLVFDASGSMSGSGNAGAIQAGQAYVAAMDAGVDEAAVLYFGSNVTVAQPITRDHSALTTAITMLPALGSTACWDGIFEGVRHVIENSTQSCRAVIALTDGDDNMSTHTPAQIIELATHHGIRVFTIGLGSFSGSIGDLQLIANSTGGRFYPSPTASMLTQIYDQITYVIKQTFQECQLSYDATCWDGGTRNVEMQVRMPSPCAGMDSKTVSYTAPKDTSTYTDLWLDLVDANGEEDDVVDIPLDLLTPLSNENFYPATFTVTYNPAQMTFQSVAMPPVSLLDGIATSVIKGNGTVTISTKDRKIVNGNGPLLLLRFKLLFQNLTAPIISSATVSSWTFSQGCFRPRIDKAFVRISPTPYPVTITPSGSTTVCQGETVELSATDGYDAYLWSPGGQISRTITVGSPGTYTVMATTAHGTQRTSAPVVVTVLPRPSVAIIPSGPTSVCEGKSVTLDAGIQNQYRWSTGDSTRTITVSRTGTYSVTVTNMHGCSTTSPPMAVDMTPVVVPITAKGPLTLCPNDALGLDAGPGFTSYAWNTGATTRSITVTSAGDYHVVATTTDGCVGVSDTVHVTVVSLLPPTILPSKAGPLCVGDTMTLDAGAGYDRYTWTSGQTSQRIAITQAGTYHVEAFVGGCHVVSAPLTILAQNPPIPVITAHGPTSFCEGGTVLLSTDPGFAIHRWSTGDTTASIAVGRTGSVHVTVIDGNGCTGTSSSIPITVHPTPYPQIAPDPATFCAGDSLLLDAGPDYQSYSWSDGSTTRTIMVKAPGVLTVRVTDRNGCQGISPATTVTLKPTPPQPTISRVGDVLTASAAQRYQWYRNGLPLSGETQQSLGAPGNGIYQVEIWVIGYDCSSLSDPLDVVTDIASLPVPTDLIVYPDPHRGRFTVAWTLTEESEIQVRVTTLLGTQVTSITERGTPGLWSRTVDLGHVPNGMYLLTIRTHARTAQRIMLVY